MNQTGVHIKLRLIGFKLTNIAYDGRRHTFCITDYPDDDDDEQYTDGTATVT
jgi:hypothetical protein